MSVRKHAAALVLAVLLMLGGCGRETAAPPAGTEETARFAPEAEKTAATQETGAVINCKFTLVGETALTAEPAATEAADALMELLAEGPLTVQVENYGGFEKVGELPRALPRQDSRITTKPGDIMLYQGDSIVLFYGSNTWSYTRLGTIRDVSGKELVALLGGTETQITLSR